ncbi:siderophore-interacting protein [Stackebrandtia nassauensis]|uniref:Siderophore-interacting protein n=1 Tax=Stackebrandtia nassauensis (strain DSM 44728 / CIP 108903 / NRRL B-16338 / NBRC 102104 / LLR-40K-21) TaxID=446470 RepID=D3PYL1_STANL|nr:siderophore-interacting protein [Stackebrandtia nassauensis]ADD43444.1 Siderophore-interacting protein [Stackebrandtia nassauensis DSM 44728]
MRWLKDRERHRELIAEVKAGTEPARVPYPIRIREAEVLRTTPVGTGLIRVTLGGPGTEGFEAHAPDEHVKLCYPEPDGTLRLPEPNGLMLAWPRPSPTTREYTVRRFDAATGELDIDIAVHGDGLGADWARTVAPGATIHVAGPPGGAIVPFRYDRYLLAGDITALPAIARWLEELPRDAKGWAFIEVADADEQIQLSPPEAVAVTWLHRGEAPAGSLDLLAEAVTAVTVPEGERVHVWAAGEAGCLKPLRRWVRDDLKLDKADHNITGYWKRGVADYDEDDHNHSHSHD